MGYPNVKITNTTEYYTVGDVYYASAFCKDDSYEAMANETWEASSRGVCLVTKITGNVRIDAEKYIPAEPYTSSGTSYSTFEIVEVEEESFKIVRV